MFGHNTHMVDQQYNMISGREKYRFDTESLLKQATYLREQLLPLIFCTNIKDARCRRQPALQFTLINTSNQGKCKLLNNIFVIQIK